MCFIFAELGTTGNQDAGGQLILKGKVFNNLKNHKIILEIIKVQRKNDGKSVAHLYQGLCPL